MIKWTKVSAVQQNAAFFHNNILNLESLKCLYSLIHKCERYRDTQERRGVFQNHVHVWRSRESLCDRSLFQDPHSARTQIDIKLWYWFEVSPRLFATQSSNALKYPQTKAVLWYHSVSWLDSAISATKCLRFPRLCCVIISADFLGDDVSITLSSKLPRRSVSIHASILLPNLLGWYFQLA